MNFSQSRIRAAAAAAGIAALAPSIAAAQSVGVTLNGAPVSLTPAPQERGGRVFVPLRGVFERLGASVVYAGGTINAQAGNHAVALHIGSTQATVDGQPQTLDVAPFIIGASTYVPLRFVSQALGATVNYDAANRIVALNTSGAPPNAPPPPAYVAPAPPQRSALTLRDVRPGRDATVASRRPTIEAEFGGGQADPNTLRVAIDGLNVTDQATRSPGGIVFSPPSDLQTQRHEVTVSGRDQTGAPFQRSWSFTSGTSEARNTISDLRPAEGASVGAQFVVRGRTLPYARVVVQAGTANAPDARDVIGEILGGGSNTASVRSEVTANADGSFAAPISLNARPGQSVRLLVDSTDAQSQSAAPRVVRTLTVQ
jgi:hypothetical protein